MGTNHWGSKEHETAMTGEGGGSSTRARSYDCIFCKRGFSNAQALGEHVNIHWKDTTKLSKSLSGVMKSAVVVKDEEGEEETVAPLPMLGLRDISPPPFLTKTFEMVENLETDSVVSWSRARNSFIVWDPDRFSATLLPKYFKHNNLSSFMLAQQL